MIDLDHDDVDAAFAESVSRLCQDRLDPDSGPAPQWSPGWWQAAGDLGLLALNTPDGGGSATTIAAAMEALGRANAPGPFVETFIATSLLEGGELDAVVSGSEVVAIMTGDVVPWLPVAAAVIEIDGTRAHLSTVNGEVHSIESLAGEPWGRADLTRTDELGDASAALALGDVAAAAYLVGEAQHLLASAAAYAADRIQFRVPIGSFQAVAHPLATCHVRLSAARTLSRMAAHSIAVADSAALASAATARRSATKAALETAFQVHQTYGAMGFTVEGPIANRSAKIRQTSLAGQPTGGATDLILKQRGL